MTDLWEDIDQSNAADAFNKYLEVSRSSFKYKAENHPEIYYEWLDLEPQVGMFEILDIGCGNGFDAYYIYKYLKKIQRKYNSSSIVKGIDKSEKLIHVAQQRQIELSPDEGLGNLSFEIGSIYSLPDSYEENFDRVYANYLFQHLSEPKAALYEMIRVTKPGGKFFVTDTDWSSLTCTNVLHMSELFKHTIYHSVKNPMILPTLTSLFEQYDAVNSDYEVFERTFTIGMFEFSLDVFRWSGVKQ